MQSFDERSGLLNNFLNAERLLSETWVRYKSCFWYCFQFVCNLSWWYWCFWVFELLPLEHAGSHGPLAYFVHRLGAVLVSFDNLCESFYKLRPNSTRYPTKLNIVALLDLRNEVRGFQEEARYPFSHCNTVNISGWSIKADPIHFGITQQLY